jgi:carboxypeptidase T
VRKLDAMKLRRWGLGLAGAVLLTACAKQGVTSQVPGDLGAFRAEAVANGKPAVVSISFQNRALLGELAAAGMDIWYVDDENAKVYGQITSAQLEFIRRRGLRVRLVQGPGPGVYNRFDSAYRSYDEMLDELRAMARSKPAIARLLDIGDGWEKTQGRAGRDIWCLRIGTQSADAKPALLFCGAHHAREIVTPEIVLNLAKMLIDGYGNDPELTNFVENRDIYLVPMVNPEGHKLASEGVDWRKNVNLSVGGGTGFGFAPNGPGVDLNRNYGYKWGGPGASTRVADSTFRGPGAFSEPETQAIKNLIESRKFTFLMSYHSFSNLILWPWGHTKEPPPDPRLPAIGKKLGDLSGYRPQQSVNLYPTSGDTTDWAFGTHGILSYTTEIGSYGDGFDPPYNRVPTFWKQNEGGARLLLSLADNPGHVQGPTLDKVVSGSAQASVTANRSIKAVEAFYDAPGPDGRGVPFDQVQGKTAILSLNAGARSAGKKRLLLVHAQDTAGNWGPYKATFVQ